MSGFANSVKRNTRENYYKLYLGQPSGGARARAGRPALSWKGKSTVQLYLNPQANSDRS